MSQFQLKSLTQNVGFYKVFPENFSQKVTAKIRDDCTGQYIAIYGK